MQCPFSIDWAQSLSIKNWKNIPTFLRKKKVCFDKNSVCFEKRGKGSQNLTEKNPKAPQNHKQAFFLDTQFLQYRNQFKH